MSEEATTYSSRRTIRMLAISVAVFLAAYFVTRLYFFISAAEGLADIWLACLILLAESYSLVHAFGYLLGVYRLETKPLRYRRANVEDALLPPVAVIVPVRNEPPDVVETTLVSLAALDYPRCTPYLLDASTMYELREANRLLALRYHVEHVFPLYEHASKAGTVNEFLRSTQFEYVAIFDADQRPMPHFLRETVALALGSPRAAYVQTPQLYANFSASKIAKGAAMQHSIFYEVVCEAKQAVGAAFCCGTNVLIRRSAFLSVGGFDEHSITEDFATSLYLHIRGYRSLYYNHVLAFGMAPTNLAAFFTQQARWATGTVSVLWPLLRAWVRSRKALTVSQWWEYALSSTYYFIGVAFFILMMGPILFLLVGYPTYFTNPVVYVGTFLPYMVLNTAMFYLTLRRRNYTFGNLFYGIILGSLSFPVLMRAAFRGLSGRRFSFTVTPKGPGRGLTLAALSPWLLMMLANTAAIVVGFTKLSTDPYAIGVNMFWCAYHIALLSQIFVLNHTRPVVAEGVPAVQ